MTNVNNITAGIWTTSTLAPTTITTTSVTISPAPKKTRIWTGKPRGRTLDQIDTLMRNRVSYKDFVKQAQERI